MLGRISTPTPTSKPMAIVMTTVLTPQHLQETAQQELLLLATGAEFTDLADIAVQENEFDVEYYF